MKTFLVSTLNHAGNVEGCVISCVSLACSVPSVELVETAKMFKWVPGCHAVVQPKSYVNQASHC